MTDGWVIMNANMDRYRAWQDGGTVWVKDLADATFYARRVDAEAVHLDDVAAWRVVLKPLPDGGEAVHTGQLRDEPAPEFLAKSASNSTGEAALPEAVAWRWRFKAWIYGDEATPGSWTYADSKPNFSAALLNQREVEPLYAAPLPPPVAELPEHIAGMVFNWAREAQEEIDAHGEWLQEHNEEPDPGMDWIEIHPESLIRLEIALRPFASRAPTDTGEGE